MANGSADEVVLPAGEGRGLFLKAGSILDLIDVNGQQVADLLAWRQGDPGEYMSPAHTVSCNASIRLGTGFQLFSNRRNAVFTILRDDVERHDIIVPCCDTERYRRDFGLAQHGNCLDNFSQAGRLLGVDAPEIANIRGELAWNVFMHNIVEESGTVRTEEPTHSAGATISLRAEFDLIVLVSACPQDLTPCNAFLPTPLRLVVRSGASGDVLK